ncbi:hypothetical protein HQN86_12615 [Pedobacter panaciterrae]|uniref:hypothetical protein n=1 Tax=Pedobacter panaciterrae TaxID=363849 RepID=UPI00155D99FE|nr:hypothetical protein [Pedobacter panaciterrae]NQX54460.1 hypothetical protein [Pedobacter panaciterrae]
MNWISFLTYLGLGYGAYYFIVFLLDSRASSGSETGASLPVLTFSETVLPEKVSLEDFGLEDNNSSAGGAASIGMGGVSIKELFNLARKDAIEFTKSVSF